jgi:hypothetical protein
MGAGTAYRWAALREIPKPEDRVGGTEIQGRSPGPLATTFSPHLTRFA